MAVNAESIMATISPYIKLIIGYLWLIGKFLLVITGIIYVIMLFTYNVKVVIHEQIKGGRTVIRSTRAKETRDKETNKVQLQLFDLTLFLGKRIDGPPSECIFSYKSFFAKKIYYFVYKDGIYYPIQNLILGREYVQKDINGKIVMDENKQPKKTYSIEGTGLEVTRDYNSEQAILGLLQSSAVKYRNKKPIEMVAMYGLMIIVIVGSIVVIVYSLKQVGNLFNTLQSLSGPIEKGVNAALSQKIGPG